MTANPDLGIRFWTPRPFFAAVPFCGGSVVTLALERTPSPKVLSTTKRELRGPEGKRARASSKRTTCWRTGHSPRIGLGTWLLDDVQAAGKVRVIGVSNFNERDLANIISNADVDFAISAEDMAALKTAEHIRDYGDSSFFPVFGGRM